jgi:succinate-semialdehyde dehydrogenase/glutarate-semialdehyde dehydrogenase
LPEITVNSDAPDTVHQHLDDLSQSYNIWSARPIAARAQTLRAIADQLIARRDECAHMMTKEMGKPIAQALAEVEKCAQCCRYYADHAEHMLAVDVIHPAPLKLLEEAYTYVAEHKHLIHHHPQTSSTEPHDPNHQIYVRFDPLGVVLVITPWNFPFWLFFRSAVPALLAGNVIMHKAASMLPGCAQLIQEIMMSASPDLPLMRNVYLDGAHTEAVIAHPAIGGIAFTGSESVGRRIASLAGQHLKKTVLELGGSDAFIVCEDAYLQAAATAAASARCANAGQICISPKRFIVLASVHDAFVDLLTQALKSVHVGDPSDMATHTGPLAKAAYVALAQKQVDDSLARGAQMHFQASIPASPYSGAFFPPTVLTNVATGMPVYHEEVFAPVFAVIQVQTIEEAIRVANDTPYGLGANIWSQDREKAQIIASKLRVGTVAINDVVKSDPRYPLGGTKSSGLGRELGSYGIKEFVNIKSVVVR